MIRCLPLGSAVVQKGIGLMVQADLFRMWKKISDRSPFYRRCCRKGREGVAGLEPGTLPGDGKVGLDPAATWGAPCSWSYGSLRAPADSYRSLWVPMSSYGPHGSLWAATEPYRPTETPWVVIDLYRSLFAPMDPYGLLWTPMHLYWLL